MARVVRAGASQIFFSLLKYFVSFRDVPSVDPNVLLQPQQQTQNKGLTKAHSLLTISSPIMSNFESLCYPDRARQSCAALQVFKKKKDLPAWFDETAATRMAQTLNREEIQRLGSTLAVEANQTKMAGTFASHQNEAGLIFVMHALDFGGGWRQELHRHHQRGAFATVKPGVEALWAANPMLKAKPFVDMTCGEVATLFSLQNNPQVAPFVELLTKVCNEVGTGLQKAGFDTAGDYIEHHVERLKTSSNAASLLTKELVDRFPFTFNDVYNLFDQKVFLYKKAQLVVGELCFRFRDEDVRYNFQDLSKLTAFIDNVIVAVLRKHGVVATTTELSEKIETHQALPKGSPEEVSLRAAAMVGVEQIASKLGIAPCTFGNYLWGHLGKNPEHRKYNRHATKDTVFY